MKRSLILGMIMGLVFCLVLPFHGMAANLSVQTSDGFTIILDKPILGTSIDANGNQIVLINSAHDQLPLQQFEPMITISGASANNGTAIVTGTKGNAVTFNILATDTAGTPNLSFLGPIIAGETPFVRDPANPSAQNMGQFSKAYNSAGTYQVVFGAVTPPDSDSTQRSIAIVITDPNACQATVTAAASGVGGAITSALSQTVACGGTATFSGTLTSGATAQVSEGSYSPAANGLNWTWTVTAPTTTTTKNVTITFSTPTSCQSTVTATASGTGGTITSALSQTVACGYTATFSGTLTSGTSVQVSEGSYSCPNGLNWTWTVTAPTTATTKNVTITFGGSTPPPTNGWLPLNNQIGSTNFFGYNPSVGGRFFSAAGATTYYFYIDPTVYVALFSSGTPRVMVGDVGQTLSCSPHLYMLDSANNRAQEVPLSCNGVQCSSNFSKTVRWNGNGLLLQITTTTPIPSLLAYWTMN